jgi:hypothetical protein
VHPFTYLLGVTAFCVRLASAGGSIVTLLGFLGIEHYTKEAELLVSNPPFVFLFLSCLVLLSFIYTRLGCALVRRGPQTQDDPTSFYAGAAIARDGFILADAGAELGRETWQ